MDIKTNFQLLLTDEAKTSIRQIVEFASKNYNRERGKKIYRSLNDELKRIEKNPSSFSVFLKRPNPVYSVVVEKTFRIFYKIQGNTVIVLEILHVSRDIH